MQYASAHAAAAITAGRRGSPRACGPRSGFSLIEILFAIMIMGIGFIMIAAAFPVAIQQSQATLEESMGPVLVQNGRQFMEASINTLQDSNGIGFVTPTADMICSADPRFAFASVYIKQPNNPNALVWVFPLMVRNGSAYQPTPAGMASIMPHWTKVQLSPGEILFIPPASAADKWEDARNIAAEGAAVVTLTVNGTNGSVSTLHLGNPIDRANGRWSLIFRNGIGSIGGATSDAFLVGCGPRDPGAIPNATNNPYEGKAQDIAVSNVGPFIVPISQ